MTEAPPPAGLQVTLKRPSAQVLKLAAIACFVVDVLAGAIGFGERIYFSALGLALYVASEV